MAFDLEEQEQLASIKAWWNTYGNLVTWILIAVLGAFAAWNGWKYYQRSQALQAGQLYEELQKGVTAKDNALVQRAATDMETRFSRTTYAQMAALTAAKSAVDANDMAAAKAQLQWIIGSAGEEEYKAIARIRLAGLLLDEKAYDEGLKLVSGEFPAQFAALASDRRGDILVAQNKLDEARAAYKTALDKTDDKNPGRQLIQLKLDAIGGEPVKAAA
jgi:predicted negative regulator of RcsB-dependent stress response